MAALKCDAMNATDHDLRSLARLVVDTQASYARLTRLVGELGLVPAVTLDGVPYFAEADQELLIAALACAREPGARTARDGGGR
jgi:hypothetical protein